MAGKQVKVTLSARDYKVVAYLAEATGSTVSGVVSQMLGAELGSLEVAADQFPEEDYGVHVVGGDQVRPVMRNRGVSQKELARRLRVVTGRGARHASGR